jgi:hypothetical protein
MGDLRGGGQSQEIRLRSISQDGSTSVNGALVSSGKSSADTSSTSESTSLISTATGPQEGQQGNVEVVEEGDVTGTVCDCGEILIPGGGISPWLALGGVPLVCVLIDCSKDRCEGPQCNPPCTGPECNPPQVPEPATIFLLGSGLAALGAKARRRFAKPETDNAVSTKMEV